MLFGKFASGRFGGSGSTSLLASGSYTITGLWDFTHATGLKVGGTAFTATSIANWNTAFGWGDHATAGYEPGFSKNTAFNKNFAGSGAATTVSRSDHTHSGVYEPAFTTLSVGKGGTGATSFGANNILLGSGSSAITSVGQNTGFNKSLGTTAGTVAEGNHTHSGYLTLTGGTMLGDLDIGHDGVDLINFTFNSTGDNRGIAFNSRTALSADYNDGWLRLNAASEFSNGVYTPGAFYASSTIRTDSNLYFSSANKGLTAVTGSYGNVQTVGTGTGSWQGYSIDGRVVFMEDGAGTSLGIFDDVNNKWIFNAAMNGASKMYYSGSKKIETSNTGATVTGTLTGTVDVASSSDRRLKKNIRPFEVTLSEVADIGKHAKRFVKKEEPDNEMIGFIAQTIEKKYPEFIRVFGKDKMRSLSYGNMVTLSLAVMPEILKRLEKLENDR